MIFVINLTKNCQYDRVIVEIRAICLFGIKKRGSDKEPLFGW